MDKRLNAIYNVIPFSDTFADIGCDHGYIAKEVIKNNKCKKAVISDISEKSLLKAQTLLKKEILEGIVIPVVSDGFSKLPTVDTALIAGLGGEEIIKILLNAKSLPFNLILSPMRNCDKVRVTLINLGYKIEKDFCVLSGEKFYDVIKATVGKDKLNKEEIEFGRSNLVSKNDDFILKIKCEIEKLSLRLKRDLSNSVREKTENEIERLNKYVVDK